ncbi:nitrogen permease regulator of amino acid transport activity 3-domain-containing protein [Mycena sp. CBHHK59/15]|nr:nitrogen permease regulator of amino acid transport activity 3-domain-containing protein [Mycena sp. CBHHK59/15]
MSETLLAILLVTASAKGPSLVYRWPPSPTASPRFSRAKPDDALSSFHLDNPWRASHTSDAQPDPLKKSNATFQNDPEREWKRPSAFRDRSMSFSSSGSRPSSARDSPSKDGSYLLETRSIKDEYDYLFGYSSEFLANLLCPQRSMCHQKFELLVDDLAFIGHPVSAEEDGNWRFKPEKPKLSDRGRESRARRIPQTDRASSASPISFVMVLDVPDPSSSASGNITKYFDIIYQQLAFPIAAVLFQEQVLHNFVEEECDILGSLKDSCSAKGDEFASYVSQALDASSIAPAMKTLYEALKTSSVAYITIHDLPLELQLPPYLDVLLHSEEDNEMEFLCPPDDDDYQVWGQELSFGYRLPSLTAWKSLLLLDDGPEGIDPYANLRRSLIGTGDRSLVEGLIKFLEIASVTLSLADMASLLDWDLETQIFPTVRWLVHHRRAKVVDIVHSGLKTVFTLPLKFDSPLAELTAEFDKKFSASGVSSLPQLLSAISTSSSKQSDTHFFASVVHKKEAIPLYHDVVLWMLKRDMLITLHLRIRIMATMKIKDRVKFAKGRTRDKKGSGRKGHSKLRNQLGADAEQSPPSFSWLSLSPKSARRYSRQSSVSGSRNSRLSELILQEDSGDSDNKRRDEEETPESQDEDDESCDENEPSMINDPGRATTLQRRWLSAMSEGKDPHIARRFEQINQYFDGKKTDDEILYRAEMSRRELREVLHHYEEHSKNPAVLLTSIPSLIGTSGQCFFLNSLESMSQVVSGAAMKNDSAADGHLSNPPGHSPTDRSWHDWDPNSERYCDLGQTSAGGDLRFSCLKSAELYSLGDMYN